MLSSITKTCRDRTSMLAARQRCCQLVSYLKATFAAREVIWWGRTPHVWAERQSHHGFIQVDAAESKHEVLKSKIEIRLKKRAPVSWPTLEKSEQKAAANFSDPSKPNLPSYPSSYNK